jgi:allantoinase
MWRVAAGPAFALWSDRLVAPEGERAGSVIVQDGVIADVLDTKPAGIPLVDLGHLALLPGLVDSHVHVNEPGRTEWEGFATATRAAAAGGITTIVDMPLNSVPVTTSAEALARKRAAAEPSVHVDCAFWGGLVPGSASAIAGLLDAGACGVKAFLVPSGIDDFPAATEADLRAALPILAERGAPLLVHAELETESAPPPGNPRHHASHVASRPPAWERDAVALLLRLCRELRAPIHIVHLSASAAAALVAQARDEGLPLTAETCPHYLAVDAESVPDGHTEFKCAPPLRDAANREALWQALRDGTIGLVVSDHSPCLPSLKADGDFAAAWGGIASIQHALPVVWTEARHRGFDLTDLARWMAEGPARLAGLSHRKGRLARGHDADFVVFDPDARQLVTAASLLQRHKLTPYLGRTLAGVVQQTFVRGRSVYVRGEDLPGPGGLLLSASHGLH